MAERCEESAELETGEGLLIGMVEFFECHV